jgi:SSS family solute:Na+ symporter
MGALVAGVVISFITPKNQVTKEDALRILSEERAKVDSGSTFDDGKNINM